MDILYLHRTQATGVEGVHISELIKAWVQLGHVVDIVAPTSTKVKKNTTNKIFKIISRVLPEIIFECLEIMYNVIAYKKIKEVFKKKTYDVIYERYAIFNLVGVLIAKQKKIPLIMEINYTSFTPIYRKRSKLLLPLANFIDKIIFQKVDAFAVVSTYLRDQLVSLKIPAEKIVVIPNAADPEKFHPKKTAIDIRNKYNLHEKKVIGFVGGFYPWHGLDLLIDCFIALKKKHTQVSLMLIGNGPLKLTLQKRIQIEGLENSVIFIEFIAHNNLPQIIAAFDIAVMPNSNTYGSPMKIFEYMSMAKPVIAPRLGPLEDVIINGQEGILFNPGEVDSMQAAFEQLLQNPSLHSEMAYKARENIILNHTWRKNAEKIIQMYHNIRN